MWATVVMFAFMAMWDPVRLGVAVFVVMRNRPIPALFVFCLGGITSSLLIGLSAVYLLHGTSKRLVADMNSSTQSIDPADAKIVIGALVLVVAVALLFRAATKTPVPASVPGSAPGSTDSEPLVEQESTSVTARLTAWGRQLMRSQSLWMSFLAGLWAGPGPHVELIGALTVILASGNCKSVQVAAVVVYAIVSFAFAEIPLLCYLIAPAKTAQYLGLVPNWLRARRIWVMATALTVLGLYLLASGTLS
ncbi:MULTISPECIES: GAP family protein [unclassified Mycolicibacterium]|uniref:GAP family protein n=1 Tax=unclassified Mycolicibacterium TaxID=2636767 RepID=UPI0013909FE0|nr:MULTISPECIES: GAP family protein [unclassified Mycolicibacterium]